MKKTYKLIFPLVCALAASSCQKSEWLDRDPYTQIKLENYYKNENNFKLATIAAYEALGTNTIGGMSVSGGTYHCGLPIIMNSPSDELFTYFDAGTSVGQYTQMINCGFTQATTGLRRMWTAFFAGIDRCNAVIEHAQAFPENKTIQGYAVESRFLRAFYYWYLAQIFGGVPIVSYHSDGMEARSCLEDVYNYIISDLDFAAENLPSEKGEGAIGVGSVTKYTAEAYTARICNYLAACKRSGTGADLVSEQPLNDFAWVDADSLSRKAYFACKDILENSPYVLTREFTNLFRETTKDDQHEECLFMAENYLSGSENAFPSSSNFALAPQSEGIAEYGQSSTCYARYAMASPILFGMFSPEDPRRDWFCVGSGTGSVNSGTLKEEVASDGYVYVIPFKRVGSSWNANASNSVDSPDQTYIPFLDQTCVAVGKFRFVQVGQITTHLEKQHSLSFPLMRLAEVYLMYAEAIHYYLGDDDLAREQFRPVLLRACRGDEAKTDRLMAAYRKADFIDELLETRERELCYEGNRKYDLFRFNRLDSALKYLYEKPVFHKNDKDYFAWQGYYKFGTDIPVVFQEVYFEKCVSSIKGNWKHYKMWAPISSLQREANPNLTQNARW